MKNDDLGKQLDFYSNAIIGFVVIQGLGFCYQFGTSEVFSNHFKNNIFLSTFLTLCFLAVMVGGCVCNNYIGNALKTFNEPQKHVIGKIYFVKTIIIAIFGLIPFSILICFAICPAIFHFHH